MDVDAFLHDIQANPDYADQIVYVGEDAARPAQYGAPAQPLPAPLPAMLRARGIDRLYTHQAQALDAIRGGAHVAIVTGTASGKSLCYTLPLLEALASDPDATSLLLFPTKALCQDQFQRLGTALHDTGLDGILAGVIDGDTPAALRRRLRDAGRVIFTNPDMLHSGLLPQHARWAGFFAQLRYLVLDELHVYHGIFGSNMSNLLRRVFRLCAHYGSHPQVIACSATIGNPGGLAERLTGLPFTVIATDGSPRGKRTYVFWNPPRLRETDWRSRRSANVEAHELMALLVQRGVRTITFSKAKMTAEMIHRYVAERLRQTAPRLMSALSPYRGGYLPEERREIERKLFNGELLGVSTTRALELGIDVGGLDASILVGYPGTLASFFQQAGRAGRAVEDALVILIGLDTPANQYVMSTPEYLFARPIEQAVIDPDNPFVLTGHLRCATHELALLDAELAGFGPYAGMVLRVLQENLKVQHLDDRWYHAAAEIPQHEISLRGYADANVLIEDVESGKVLGELNKFDAPPLLHPQAIYLHQGDTYEVLSLDLTRNLARVKRVEVDYYTQPLGGTDVNHIDHCLRDKPFGAGQAFWGEVTAYFQTGGFEKIRFYELDAISRHGLELPVFSLETMAVWIVPPEDVMQRVRLAGLDAFNGLRGIGFAVRMLLPLFLTCDTRDFSHTVGSVNSAWNAVFIYERYPLGLGFTEQAYDRLQEILPAARAAIAACPCADGCPCCVGKPLRGELVWNPERGEASIPSKASALAILDGLLGDGTQLAQPDTQALTATPHAEELRLETAVRRRLERMREPKVFHPIEPNVETAYPDSEREAELPTADVARRGEQRRDFHRELRKRIAERVETAQLPVKENARPPGMKPNTGINLPGAFPGRPMDSPPVELGDSLAARARRLKKQREE